jgi:hypothetical protein
VLRDSTVALLQSRYGFIPIWDHAGYIVDSVLGREHLQRFWASGVAQSTLVGATRKQRAEYTHRLAGERDLYHTLTNPGDLIKSIYPALQWLSMHAELATRYGEFRLALNNAGIERTLLERLMGLGSVTGPLTDDVIVAATRAARDLTTDFQRGGRNVKQYSRYKAFFNARVQGYLRMGETMSQALQDLPMVQVHTDGDWKWHVESTRLNLAGKGADLLFKLGLLSTLSALLWHYNRDDEEWKQKEEWEKSAYWFIKLPG